MIQSGPIRLVTLGPMQGIPPESIPYSQRCRQ